MNLQNLKPVSQLSKNVGVKSIIYGMPGTGKTPMVQTCPRPVMCITEPGTMTLRKVNNVLGIEAYTPQMIDEFFTWVFNSNETANFDTIAVDSISQMAEIILTEEQKRNKDGRAAYGELSRRVMNILNGLYFLKNKHVYLIAKLSYDDLNGVKTKRPFFPGQDLNIKVPHLYDEVWHIGEETVPGQPKPVMAIRTKPSFGVVARDRSGNLAELEQPNIGALFTKCMA